MGSVLKIIQQTPLPLVLEGKKYTIPIESISSWLPHFAKEDQGFLKGHLKSIVDKILLLQLAEVRNNQLHYLDSATSWQKRSVQDQAITLYRNPLLPSHESISQLLLFSEKNIRESEKSLKRVLNCGWVTFEEFVKGLIALIGNAEPVELKKKGKRWKYTIPVYSPEEIAFIQSVIFERLFESGIVASRHLQGAALLLRHPFWTDSHRRLTGFLLFAPTRARCVPVPVPENLFRSLLISFL